MEAEMMNVLEAIEKVGKLRADAMDLQESLIVLGPLEDGEGETVEALITRLSNSDTRISTAVLISALTTIEDEIKEIYTMKVVEYHD
jgi:hypothetical protein